MSIFDHASKKVTQTVRELQKKTNDTMAIKRIESQIRDAESEIQGLYTAIGQAAYAAHAEDKPFEGGDEFYAGIDALNARIADFHKELDKLNDVKRCTECGAQVQRLAKFCPQCGAKLEIEVEVEEEEIGEEVPEIEICPNCGTERKDQSRFCESCGHEFETAAGVAEEDDEEPEIEED